MMILVKAALMAESGEGGGVRIDPEAPMARLLTAYAAPDRREAHRLVWAFDERLAALVRSTSQPMIGQMRIAWWEEVLSEDASSHKGKGDPLVDALRDAGIAGHPALRQMLDGWEALLDTPLTQDALTLFARARGGGLFAALADDGGQAETLLPAGSLWALWDLAAHLQPGDPVASEAIALARQWLGGVDAMRWSKGQKPLQIVTMLARADVARGTVPQPGLTPSRYARLLRMAMLGR